MTMEVDGASAQPAASPTIALPILATARTARARHGLRTGDYGRYRAYCTKKLGRLYRGLKLTHGRGKYQKRALDAGNVTEDGHLAVLLFSAERAWARAQARKAGLGAAESPTGAVRKGLVSRAVRAARWAADLARLTSDGGGVRTTPRTAVEAAAYAAWLDGVARSERGTDWAGALGALARARVLTEALARAGPPDARAAARAQLVDLDPALRFAQYQLGRAGGGGEGGAATADAAAAMAQAAVAAEPGLAAALAAVAAEGGGGGADGGGGDDEVATAASSASGFATYEWRGASYPVGSERVRAALAPAATACARAAAAAADASPSSSSTRIAALDAAIVALGRAKGAARQALASAGSAGAGGGATAAADARALSLALTGAQLERALERGGLVVAGLMARLDAGLAAAAAASAGGGRRATPPTTTTTTTGPPLRHARPEELMRAYDGVAKAAKSLGEVASALGGSVGELLLDEAAAAAAGAAAGRAYAAGHAFLAAKKPADACALFGRAAERADAAVDAHAECARPDAAATAALDRLATAAGVWRGVAHAQAAAAEAAAVGAVTGRVSGLDISGDGAGASGDGGASPQPALPPPPSYLSDGPAVLGEWASFAPPGGEAPRLAPLPPRLEAVPVRPFVLDLAFDGVLAPELSHRLPAGGGDGGGTFSKLFSWRR